MTDQLYKQIVFVQGDEADEIINNLYSIDGSTAHGASAESIKEAVEYLKQWETGDEEVEIELGAGSIDDIWEEGDYILSANMGLTYVGLAIKL